MKYKKTIFVVIIVLLISIGGYFLYKTAYPGYPPTASPSPAFDETAGWKTFVNGEYGFEMKYPENFFPPEEVLQPKTEVKQCDYANFFNNCSEKTTVNNVPFCLQKTSGAALGTTYETYNYTTVKNAKCFVASFTAAYPNCSNLLPAENQETQEAYDKCVLENEVTKPQTINKILSTFKFTRAATYDSIRSVNFPKFLGMSAACFGPGAETAAEALGRIDFADVNNDGKEEAIIHETSCGSAGLFFKGIFGLREDGRVYELTNGEQIVENENQKLVKWDAKQNKLIGWSPIYEDADPNCCPSRLEIKEYKWDNDEFVLISKTVRKSLQNEVFFDQ